MYVVPTDIPWQMSFGSSERTISLNQDRSPLDTRCRSLACQIAYWWRQHVLTCLNGSICHERRSHIVEFASGKKMGVFAKFTMCLLALSEETAPVADLETLMFWFLHTEVRSQALIERFLRTFSQSLHSTSLTAKVCVLTQENLLIPSRWFRTSFASHNCIKIPSIFVAMRLTARPMKLSLQQVYRKFIFFNVQISGTISDSSVFALVRVQDITQCTFTWQISLKAARQTTSQSSPRNCRLTLISMQETILYAFQERFVWKGQVWADSSELVLISEAIQSNGAVEVQSWYRSTKKSKQSKHCRRASLWSIFGVILQETKFG